MVVVVGVAVWMASGGCGGRSGDVGRKMSMVVVKWWR